MLLCFAFEVYDLANYDNVDGFGVVSSSLICWVKILMSSSCFTLMSSLAWAVAIGGNTTCTKSAVHAQMSQASSRQFQEIPGNVAGVVATIPGNVATIILIL